MIALTLMILLFAWKPVLRSKKCHCPTFSNLQSSPSFSEVAGCLIAFELVDLVETILLVLVAATNKIEAVHS